MVRRKIILIICVILLIILSIFLILFIILPMMLLPPYPAELFSVNNYDDVNHTVTVGIFNSNNKSIYFKSFYVKPGDSIEIDRGFNWCPKNRFYWFSWDEGSYTFYVLLDGTYEISHYIELYPRVSVEISIFSDNINPLKVNNLYSD